MIFLKLFIVLCPTNASSLRALSHCRSIIATLLRIQTKAKFLYIHLYRHVFEKYHHFTYFCASIKKTVKYPSVVHKQVKQGVFINWLPALYSKSLLCSYFTLTYVPLTFPYSLCIKILQINATTNLGLWSCL